MKLGHANPADKPRIEALRARLRNGEATAHDRVLYNLLRGWPPYMGFQPHTNPRHLHNGQDPYAGFMRATSTKHSRALDPALVEMLTPEQVSVVRQARAKLSAQAFEAALKAQVPTAVLKGFLRRAMHMAPQGTGSVLQHCVQTRKCATALILVQAGLASRQSLPAWMPDWFFELPRLPRQQHIDLLQYLEMHDCGKPFVYHEDTEGRAHFPDHANKSADIWALVGGPTSQQRLMRRDMELHTMAAADVPAFAADEDALVLLLAGIASLWANMADFGGADSTSFKIKLKQLDRRGRAICKAWADSAAAKGKPAEALSAAA